MKHRILSVNFGVKALKVKKHKVESEAFHAMGVLLV